MYGLSRQTSDPENSTTKSIESLIDSRSDDVEVLTIEIDLDKMVPDADLLSSNVPETVSLSPLPERTPGQVSQGYFVYTIEVPTSGLTRKGEATLTYLNKDQYYDLNLDFMRYNHNGPSSYKDVFESVISLQFSQKEKQSAEVARRLWETWRLSHPILSIQALHVVASVDQKSVKRVDDFADNGAKVVWSPAYGRVQLKFSIGCLSTDFSSQRGVKGIPLMLQIDTYEGGALRDRTAAQVKIFSDKGAERKMREEERRLNQNSLPYPCQGAKAQTLFSQVSAHGVLGEPYLYRHQVTEIKVELPEDPGQPKRDDPIEPPELPFSLIPEPPNRLLSLDCPSEDFGEEDSSLQVQFYTRQDTETAFTLISFDNANLEEMTEAVVKNYKIEVSSIRYFYLRTLGNQIIHIDSDFVAALSGGHYIMKILEIGQNDFGKSSLPVRGSSQQVFDIIFFEVDLSDPLELI